MYTREAFAKESNESFTKTLDKIGVPANRSILVDVILQTWSISGQLFLSKDSIKHIQCQPDNGILIKPFEGDPKDKELYCLQTFLKHLSGVNFLNSLKQVTQFIIVY